jgi:hypothetical protein
MTQQKKQNLAVKRQKQDAILNKVLIWFGGAMAVELVLLLLNQWKKFDLVSGLAVLVPIVAVLAMVYYLYQREFFSITLVSSISILGLWLFRKISDSSHSTYGLAFLILALAVVVLIAGLLAILQKKGGSFFTNEKEVRVFNPNASYIFVYLTCGLSALALLGGLLLGLIIAYYIIFALVAWLFIMAVYYTVKMM